MGNPTGKSGPRDKPYRDALRIEISAAGADSKLLRKIARAHLALAESGDMHAIREMADRLDGKPAQEQHVTHQHTIVEMTDSEIAQRIVQLRGVEAFNGDHAPAVDPSKLN